MNIDPKKVNKVRSAREQLGLSQADFAAKLGVTRTYVSQLEQGREPSRSLESLIERILAAQTGIKEEETMYRTSTPQRSPSEHKATLLMDYLEDSMKRGLRCLEARDIDGARDALRTSLDLYAMIREKMQ